MHQNKNKRLLGIKTEFTMNHEPGGHELMFNINCVAAETTVDGSTRSLFIHETCATDTDNVKKVFSDVKVTVFRKVIGEIMY